MCIFYVDSVDVNRWFLYENDEPKYVVTALVLNLFSGFIIIHIINPYDITEEEDTLKLENKKNNHSLKC